MLPEIQPSSDPAGYGMTRANGPLGGEVPLTGDLGDQQAATVGQVCFAPGEAKNTYGTGNFLLLNTGTELVRSNNGLLTTVCYQFGDAAPVYALEGSIAVTGSAVQWLRDQLGIISRRRAERVAGPAGRGQRRRLLRARLLRPVRAVLAVRRTRRDRRPVALQHQRAPRAGHAGGDLLPDPDVVEAMEQDSGVTPRRAAGGRRRHRQRAVHADPGRRPRRAGLQAGRGRDHGAGRRLRGGAGRRLLEVDRRAARRTGRRPALAAAVDEEQRASRATRGWKKAVDRTLDWVDVS